MCNRRSSNRTQWGINSKKVKQLMCKRAEKLVMAMGVKVMLLPWLMMAPLRSSSSLQGGGGEQHNGQNGQERGGGQHGCLLCLPLHGSLVYMGPGRGWVPSAWPLQQQQVGVHQDTRAELRQTQAAATHRHSSWQHSIWTCLQLGREICLSSSSRSRSRHQTMYQQQNMMSRVLQYTQVAVQYMYRLVCHLQYKQRSQQLLQQVCARGLWRERSSGL
jgi:hypothetical protein